MTNIATIIVSAVLGLSGVLGFNALQSKNVGGGTGTINQLQQFVSTTSPSSAITQASFGKAFRLSGQSTGCAEFDSNGILTSTGSLCGTGSGGASFFTNSGSDTYLNTGTNLQAPVLQATSTTATSTVNLLNVGNYFSVGPDLYGGLYPLHDDTFSYDNYIADFVKDVDDYASVNLANQNAGSSASIDLTFNIDSSGLQNGVDFVDYADCGMNSSTYNVPFYGKQNVPKMFYCFNSDGPLNFTAATTSSANSYIQFVTGGFSAEAMRITSTGAVGIGSTSPIARLSITNPLSTQTVLIEDQASPDPSPFLIDNAGNVAIGTTSAVAKLDVNGNFTAANLSSVNMTALAAAFSANIDTTSGILMGNTSLGTSADFRFTLRDTNNNYFTFGQPGVNNTNTLFGLTRGSTSLIFNTGRDMAIGTLSSSNLVFGTNAGERVRITPTGNVGIGETSPGSKLSVSGSATIGSSYDTTAAPTNGLLVEGGTAFGTNTNSALTEFGSRNFALRVDSTNFTGYGIVLERTDQTVNNGASVFALMRKNLSSAAVSNGNELGRIGGWGWDGDEYVLGGETSFVVDGTVSDQNVPTAFTIKTGTQNSTLAERLRVTSSGNVGIGTTTPWAKLSVNNYSAAGNTAPLFAVASSTGAGATSTAFLINSGGNVGIGVAAPQSRLQVGTLPTGSAAMVGTSAVISSGSSAISFAGIMTAPSTNVGGAFAALYQDDGAALASGDRIGGFLIGGSTGASTVVNSSMITAFASEAWTSTSAPTDIAFELTPSGVTTRTERLRIKSNGNVGIGTTTPNTMLNVFGGGLGVNPGATGKPTCAVDRRGTYWHTFGAGGVKDNVEVCAKDAADVYSWRTLY